MKRIIAILSALLLFFPLFAENEAAAVADSQDELFEDVELEDDNFFGENEYIPVAVMTPAQNFLELGIRFGVNILSTLLIVGVFYYRKSRRRDYFFTFMVFSTAMVMLLYIMGNVSVGVGLTLGLFAIFGVIRYRTETVPIREMTYLFVIIAVAAMNGLAPIFREVGSTGMSPHFEIAPGVLSVMLVANLLIIAVIAVLESGALVARTTTKLVLYDRIELIVPEKRDELIADLEKRLGLKIDSVEVGHVDFLKDAAFIKVYYTLGKGETNSVNTITRAKDYLEQ